MAPGGAPPSVAGRPPALGCLGAALVVIGGVPLVSLFTAWTTPYRTLRAGFGLGALPVALAAVVAGVWLVRRRNAPLIDVPWGRALAAEVGALSALALLSAATGSDAPGDWGAGGGLGWAMLFGARRLAGQLGAVALWMVVGVAATLLAFSGGAAVAAYLDTVAGGRDDEDEDEAEADWTPPKPPAAAGRQVALPPAGGIRSGGNPASTSGPHGAPAQQAPGTLSAEEASGARLRSAPAPRSGAGQGPSVQPTTAHPTSAPPTGTRTSASPTTPPTDPTAPSSPRVGAGLRPAHGTPPPSAPPPAPPTRPLKIRSAMGSAAADSGIRRVVRGDALPELSLLDEATGVATDADGLRATGRKIEATLASLGVPSEVVDIEVGPTVTRFGVVPGYVERGGEKRRVPVARIAQLKHDLALALAAPTIRIEAPIPGRAMVGIEVPNAETAAVGLRALLQDRTYRQAARDNPLLIALGRDVAGAVAVADLARLPHLLIAGSTGSGKSVGLNTILACLLFRNTPESLRLVLVDPKRVELSRWGKAPHLLAPAITDAPEVVGALRWLVAEMERRYEALARVGVRDLKAYNRALPAGTPPEPVIVTVIDELADLILQLGADVEPELVRIAQKARAVGLHLIVATQRPSTDVLTGTIKANFPARIAFAVASATDSRVILDTPGAEALLGRGDMLFQAPDAPRPRRIQGAFISDDEQSRLMAFWSSGAWPAPGRLPPWLDLIPGEDPDEDLYQAAVAVAERESGVNASLLQRRLKVPFSKARELLERLAGEGYVSSVGRREGGRPRVFGARGGGDDGGNGGGDGDEDGRDDDLAWVNDDT
ncbi:MAG: hypothetical protein IT332_03640 [Ardenticatenales bacterium]|nr:hypothetical protein [Ardenticatenales bacterium]